MPALCGGDGMVLVARRPIAEAESKGSADPRSFWSESLRMCKKLPRVAEWRDGLRKKACE